MTTIVKLCYLEEKIWEFKQELNNPVLQEIDEILYQIVANFKRANEIDYSKVVNLKEEVEYMNYLFDSVEKDTEFLINFIEKSNPLNDECINNLISEILENLKNLKKIF